MEQELWKTRCPFEQVKCGSSGTLVTSTESTQEQTTP